MASNIDLVMSPAEREALPAIVQQCLARVPAETLTRLGAPRARLRLDLDTGAVAAAERLEAAADTLGSRSVTLSPATIAGAWWLGRLADVGGLPGSPPAFRDRAAQFAAELPATMATLLDLGEKLQQGPCRPVAKRQRTLAARLAARAAALVQEAETWGGPLAPPPASDVAREAAS